MTCHCGKFIWHQDIAYIVDQNGHDHAQIECDSEDCSDCHPSAQTQEANDTGEKG